MQLLLGFVGTAGGLAGLVLPLSKCLVHRDPESDRMSRDGGLSLRIVSAYNGLSWDTPVGSKLLRALPAVM